MTNSPINPRSYRDNPKKWLGTCIEGPISRSDTHWAWIVFAGIIVLLSLIASILLTGGQY